MKLIGFNLNKITANINPGYKRGHSINTNVEFLNLEKETLDLLKEGEVIRIDFNYAVTHTLKEKKEEEKQGEILIKGILAISTEKEEKKAFLKSWKKKEIPEEYRIPLINLILEKCSVKAASLSEDVGLPLHLPIPRIARQTPTEEKS